MPWYSYLFFIFAVLAFFGFAFNANSKRGTGRGMAYSAVMVALWGTLGAWTGGLL